MVSISISYSSLIPFSLPHLPILKIRLHLHALFRFVSITRTKILVSLNDLKQVLREAMGAHWAVIRARHRYGHTYIRTDKTRETISTDIFVHHI